MPEAAAWLTCLFICPCIQNNTKGSKHIQTIMKQYTCIRKQILKSKLIHKLWTFILNPPQILQTHWDSMFTTILYLQLWVYQHSTERSLHRGAEDCWLGVRCKWLDTDWQQWNKNYIFSTFKKVSQLHRFCTIHTGMKLVYNELKKLCKNVVVSCLMGRTTALS